MVSLQNIEVGIFRRILGNVKGTKSEKIAADVVVTCIPVVLLVFLE